MAVAGRNPSTRDKLLARSQGELAPHLSLAAVSEASERIVGAVSVAAAIASGLSLFSALTLADIGWGWALPSIIFVSAAVILAVFAAIPVGKVISPGNLEEVDEFFSGQLRVRGRLLKGSALCLVLGLLAIPLPPLVAAIEGDEASLEISVVRHGTTLKVTATGEGLPSGRAELASASEIGNVVLGVASISSRGVTHIAAALPAAKAGHARFMVSVLHEGKVVDRVFVTWPK